MTRSRGWPSLHDAELVSFTSNLADRTATLDVRLDHLGDEAGKGSWFRIVFHVVRAISAAKWQQWPLPDRGLSDPELMGRRDWGRMVSIELRNFVGPSLRIHDAALRRSFARELPWPMVNCQPECALELLTLDIDGTGSEIGSVALAIAFERINVLRDEKAIAVEESARRELTVRSYQGLSTAPRLSR
jgi:hypothetical protein